MRWTNLCCAGPSHDWRNERERCRAAADVGAWSRRNG